MGGDRGGHLAGHLADGREHGQSAVFLLDDLATDGGEAAFGDLVEQRAVGHRHVVEGHQGHVRPREAELFGGGTADFGKKVRPLDDLGRRIRDLGAGPYVFVIGIHGAFARAGFHPHGMPRFGQPADYRRRKADTPVVEAALADHSDVHTAPTGVYASSNCTRMA